MSTVFVSYAREDSAHARRVVEELRGFGVNVWFDRDSIPPGAYWRDRVDAAIRTCDYFVALLSKVSVGKRGFVQKELKRALEVLEEVPRDQQYLIPVRLDDCQPTDPRLHDLQWLDLFPDWRGGIQLLRTTLAIGDVVAEPPTTATPGTTKPTRVRVTLPPEVLRQVSELAADRKTGTVEMIRQALQYQTLWVADQVSSSRLVVTDKFGKLEKEIILLAG